MRQFVHDERLFGIVFLIRCFPNCREAGERVNGGAISPLAFRNGGGSVFPWQYHGNFMVYQCRIETILLQLFAHPDNSEGFSTISDNIFEVSIVAKQKQA